MRLDVEGVEICAGDWRERCVTEIVGAGAYVVAVSTVVRSRSVALASSYLADLAGETAATHMRLADPPARFSHRVVQLGGISHARGCLLDHAAELRDLLAEVLDRDDVRVDVDELALVQAGRVWDQPAA